MTAETPSQAALVPGLHGAGQGVLCLGIPATILGAHNTVNSIAGPELFRESIRIQPVVGGARICGRTQLPGICRRNIRGFAYVLGSAAQQSECSATDV